MSQIKIGLVGASRIAVEAVLAPARYRDDIDIVAVAASSQQRAEAYAETHSIPNAAPSVDALLARTDIDLIYIGLPPAMHHDLTIAALRAGKHVLCEKPFALSAEEARSMVSEAEKQGRCLIEAYHYRFHPLFHKVLEIVRRPEFGVIRSVTADFTVPVKKTESEFRYKPHLGGGAFMDLGCYPLHWARTVVGEPAAVIEATTTKRDGAIDVALQARIGFPSGAEALLSCDMDEAMAKQDLSASLEVRSDRAVLRVVNPLNPGLMPSLLTLDGAAGVETHAFEGATFPHQLDHVVAQIHGRADALTGGADSIETMRLIDQIRAAAGLPEFPRAAS